MTIRFIDEEPKIKFLDEDIKQSRQGYIDQILNYSPQRQQEMARISQEYGQGNISAPEYVLQNLGEAAGNIGDVVGRGIGDVVSGAYGLLPENLRQGISEKAAPVGQAIAPAIGAIGEAYGDVKESYPRTMENIEALTNIGMLAAPMMQRGAQIKSGVTRSGQAIKQKTMPKPTTMKADDLKQVSSQLFKKADETGGVLKPQITNQFVDDVLSELPQTDLGKAVIGETPVTKLTERISTLKNKPMSLKAAQEIDEALGDLAYSNMNAATGELDKQGFKLLNIQSKFRNSIEQAPENMVMGGKKGFENLKEARKYWSTSLRLRDVEKAIQKGLSTEQPQTGVKNAFKTLLNSKKIANYSPAEVQAIRQAAEKGVLTDVLGTMGSRLNPQFMSAGIGITTLDPISTGAAFLGTTALSGGARKAATGIQLKKARRVEDLIRQRVNAGDAQRMALTPELKLLGKELGLSTLPSGNVSAILDELQAIQETSNSIVGAQ